MFLKSLVLWFIIAVFIVVLLIEPDIPRKTKFTIARTFSVASISTSVFHLMMYGIGFFVGEKTKTVTIMDEGIMIAFGIILVIALMTGFLVKKMEE